MTTKEQPSPSNTQPTASPEQLRADAESAIDRVPYQNAPIVGDKTAAVVQQRQTGNGVDLGNRPV